MRITNRLRYISTLLLLASATLTFAQEENLDTIADWYHLSAYLVAALMITVFVMGFYNRVFYFREQLVNTQAKRLNTQLSLVLGANKTKVWTYDPTKRIFTTLREGGTKRKDFTPLEFSRFFFQNEYAQLRNVISTILDGDTESETITLQSRENLNDEEKRIYEINVSVLSRTKKGRPKMLIGVAQDITEESFRRDHAKKLALRYHTVFNSSLIDMIYYDGDGFLSDLNPKACETFGITDREQLLKRKVKITDIPAYRNLDINKLKDNFTMSSITDIDKVKATDERVPELKAKGKMYYEVTVSPVRDADGKLHGVMAAGRNITEMVESQHQQKEASLLLQKTTNDIQGYIDNINYTLRASGVRLLNYYPDSHELHILSDLNATQYNLQQIRCFMLLDKQEWRRVRGHFLRMDHRKAGAFSDTLRTIFRDEKGRNIYLNFNMLPITDADGRITHYTGLFRNETEMTYTEKQLHEETLKAQETEELKNTFLLNMSYEIRTPLNAVLGFAELFNGPHDEEDEPVFAEEIRRNTGDLLALINDILFISRLDAHMVEFNYQECDFATLFDGFCYMGWSNVAPGVKMSVENPYNHLVVNIDQQNLSEVIQKLCTNAARFTTEGYVRAKYEYRHGELNISVEDTGRGISPEMMKHVFDRFVKDERNESCGTGLDMPIIREIVEQMGGTMEIQSEENKGTTAYVIIPCKLISMEKKTEIML